jgi:nicotinamide riboside transporter PnuC
MNADERGCVNHEGYEGHEGGEQRVVTVIDGDRVLGMIRLCNSLGWVAMVLAVCGVLLNNARLWPCFVLWIASNGISAYIHHWQGPRSLMIRDLIFLALAIVGLWQWTR